MHLLILSKPWEIEQLEYKERQLTILAKYLKNNYEEVQLW